MDWTESYMNLVPKRATFARSAEARSEDLALGAAPGKYSREPAEARVPPGVGLVIRQRRSTLGTCR